MQDARNAGECLSLKGFLQIEQAAFAYFIDDLKERALECRAEKVFTFLTSRRHRQAIDEAIQRFQRMTAPIPANGTLTSIRSQTSSLIVQYLHRLQATVPSIDTAEIAVNIGAAVDWTIRLDQCALIVDELVGELEPLQKRLQTVLDEKSEICRQIEASLRQMAAII